MNGLPPKWYQRTFFQVMFHGVAWILFFLLPAILSVNARPDSADDFRDRSRFERFRQQDSMRMAYERPIDSSSKRAFFFRRNPPSMIAVPAMPSAMRNVVTWVSNIGLVLLFYFNALFLIPRFLYRKKRLIYFGLLLLAFLLTNFMVHSAIAFELGGRMPFQGHIIFNLFPFLLIITASTLYRYLKDKIRHDQIQQEKENEQLKTELSFLRSQISPHFLFNVMNSAVSLARTGSAQLEEVLIKISQMLRYMLYESEFSKVSLQRETEYLENYIELQQLRFGDQVQIHFRKMLHNEKAGIEPMLLIPFVENAFKHGIGNIQQPRINIRLVNEKETLYFEVRNKCEQTDGSDKDMNSGIGLPNVRRRLELLYPGEHSLLLRKEDNWFIAELTIQLS